MLKAEAKGVRNSVKTRGGILFYNSVKQSLRINNCVRSRALKDRNCAVPVKCGAEGVAACKDRNKQQTVGNCVKKLKFDPKDLRKFGLARTLSFEAPNVAPEKFFCLPFFDLQVERDARVEPRIHEDIAGFLFVDLNKFLARNSTSVLHNMIFQWLLER